MGDFQGGVLYNVPPPGLRCEFCGIPPPRHGGPEGVLRGVEQRGRPTRHEGMTQHMWMDVAQFGSTASRAERSTDVVEGHQSMSEGAPVFTDDRPVARGDPEVQASAGDLFEDHL